jgi:hypothetical protein
VATIAQAIVTIIGVVVAGTWTYWLFVRRRQVFPRATLVQRIFSRSASDGYILISVDVEVVNRGDVVLRLVSGRTYLHQLVPLPANVLAKVSTRSSELVHDPVVTGWTLMGLAVEQAGKGQYLAELEPNESVPFHYDFVVNSSVQVVSVFSHFDNEAKRKRRLGWRAFLVSRVPTTLGD